MLPKLTFFILLIVFCLTHFKPTLGEAAAPSASEVRPLTVVVDIIWGKENTESPLIQDLLDSAIMKRLQGVDQSGPCRYFGYAPAYSRYEHCVGVWALLKRFNCSLPEQVAGLLHDASHTAFSHLADHLFATPQTEHSYHDTIHLWFLRQMKLQPLLAMYDLSLKQMDVDHPGYKGLKQPLPDLCADRIEYNLHTGILFKIISTEEAKKILNNLKFENGRWFFTSVDSAKKFANLSLYLTEHFWGAPWYYVFNHYFKEIVQRAIDLGQISRDQIHFGTDKQVMDILVKSEDPYIQRRLQGCRCIQQSFKVVETHPYNIHFKPKFRGLNPWVQKGEMFYRLTDLDPDFNKAFHALKTKCQQGFKILLKVID